MFDMRASSNCTVKENTVIDYERNKKTMKNMQIKRTTKIR